MDASAVSIFAVSLASVVGWLAVLAKLRYTRADTRIGATMLLVAIFLLSSSALYFGAPQEWSTWMVNLARVTILGSALLLLWHR